MITVLFGGSRPNGNTAQLTKFALQDLEYQWIDVTQHQFKPIRDVRHTAETITSYDDDYFAELSIKYWLVIQLFLHHQCIGIAFQHH